MHLLTIVFIYPPLLLNNSGRILQNPCSDAITLKTLKPGTLMGLFNSASLVGVKKFAYDIWGDAVNTAARMEQHSEAGKINIPIIPTNWLKANLTANTAAKLKRKIRAC